MTPANIGETIQVNRILVSARVSVTASLNRFQPMIAPTIAWLVDTGNPERVMPYTVTAAANAAMNDPAIASIEPSLPSVSAAPAPLITAPSITNTPHTTAAVPKLTMRVPTAVPNTLAASLAPSDQPRNRPLPNRINTVRSTPFNPRWRGLVVRYVDYNGTREKSTPPPIRAVLSRKLPGCPPRLRQHSPGRQCVRQSIASASCVPATDRM